MNPDMSMNSLRMNDIPELSMTPNMRIFEGVRYAAVLEIEGDEDIILDEEELENLTMEGIEDISTKMSRYDAETHKSEQVMKKH